MVNKNGSCCWDGTTLSLGISFSPYQNDSSYHFAWLSKWHPAESKHCNFPMSAWERAFVPLCEKFRMDWWNPLISNHKLHGKMWSGSWTKCLLQNPSNDFKFNLNEKLDAMGSFVQKVSYLFCSISNKFRRNLWSKVSNLLVFFPALSTCYRCSKNWLDLN